jgi:hypothetical protein
VFFVMAKAPVGRGGEAKPLGAAVPLACLYRGELASGKRCLSLVPPGDPVVLNTAQQLRVKGQSRAFCDEQETDKAALILDGIAPGASHAVWPPSASDLVQPLDTCRGWCTFHRTGHPRVKVSQEQHHLLSQAVSALVRSAEEPRIEVVQLVSVDLDGKGESDTLFSVVVRDQQVKSYAFAFSGLFLVNGNQPNKVILLLRKDSDAIVVRGTMDLDRDGRRELWLLLNPTEAIGITHMIQHQVDGRPRIIGRYACFQQVED